MQYDYNSNYTYNLDHQVPYANPQEPYEENMHDRDHYDHHVSKHDFCKRHKHYYVLLEMDDGKMYDGIIDKADNDHAYLLVPIGDQREEDNEEERQFGFGGFGGPFGGFGGPFGGFGGFGHSPFRFRRFRRFRFPFSRIRRFSFPFS
ncbi:hypothetical protein NSQ41_16010 [Aeribacillus sp. FSL K6-8210]|uniref:hypothetical protein n=1 Tax=Aeribacillus sp. FSL K6-8210 TaxID=2954683 RepID=UPI0030CDB18C